MKWNENTDTFMAGRLGGSIMQKYTFEEVKEKHARETERGWERERERGWNRECVSMWMCVCGSEIVREKRLHRIKGRGRELDCVCVCVWCCAVFFGICY